MKFKINDNIINKDGRTARISFANDDFCVYILGDVASRNLSHEELIKIGWSIVQKKPEAFVPEEGDVYYCPAFTRDKYECTRFALMWKNDVYLRDNHLCFKTKEEAVACAEFMLEAWKNREK